MNENEKINNENKKSIFIVSNSIQNCNNINNFFKIKSNEFEQNKNNDNAIFETQNKTNVKVNSCRNLSLNNNENISNFIKNKKINNIIINNTEKCFNPEDCSNIYEKIGKDIIFEMNEICKRKIN